MLYHNLQIDKRKSSFLNVYLLYLKGRITYNKFLKIIYMAKISKFTEYGALAREFKSQELYHFLKENAPALKYIEPYRGAQSFTFGQNIYYNRHLTDFMKTLDVAPLECIKGFLYASAKEQKKIENNSFNLTDTISFFNHLKNNYITKSEDLASINLEAIYKLHFQENNISFLIDFIKPDIEKGNLIQLEKKLFSFINKPETLKAFLLSNCFDVNTVLPSYQSTLLHHWTFRTHDTNERLDTIKAFYSSGADVNLKNELGQSAISLLLEQDKFVLADNVVSTFLDKIDINEKYKGKTYFHMIILKLAKNITNTYGKNHLMNIFSTLLPLSPDLQIRSGVKNKGTTILAYIDNKITDKDLACALKEKLILEDSFKSVNIKKTQNKFKL